LAIAATALTPVLAAPAQAQTAKADKPLYKDAGQPIDARVEDLIGRMTLEEKVAQLVAIWLKKDAIQTPAGDFDPAKASRSFPNGL
ncbi:beta-glucosidase, partial [Escherichia marmotae]|nr:beta-glucosidase [Escherichia marmotae]